MSSAFNIDIAAAAQYVVAACRLILLIGVYIHAYRCELIELRDTDRVFDDDWLGLNAEKAPYSFADVTPVVVLEHPMEAPHVLRGNCSSRSGIVASQLQLLRVVLVLHELTDCDQGLVSAGQTIFHKHMVR